VKKNAFIVIIFLLIGLMLILIDIINGETGLTTDSCYYLRLSKNIIDGKGYRIGGEKHTVFPPGYPIIVALAFKIFQDYLSAGQLISILSYIAVVIIFFKLLSTYINNFKLVFFVTVLLIFNRDILELSNKALSMMFYIFLVILNLLIVLRLIMKERQASSYFIMLGSISAFLYLVRPEGLIIFVINCILFFYFVYRKKLKFMNFFILIFSFSLIISPYIYFLSRASGKFVFSGKTMNLLIFEKDKADRLLYEKNSGRLFGDKKLPLIDAGAMANFGVIDYLKFNKKDIIKRIFENSISYFKAVIASLGLSSMMLLWLAYLIAKKDLEYRPILLYLSLLLASSVFLLFFKISIFWISYFPIFLFCLALIADYLIITKKINKHIVYFTIISGILVNVYFGRDELNQMFKKKDINRIEKIASAYIKKTEIQGGEIILSRKPFLPYLAELDWVRIPWFDQADEFINYMKKYKLRYFIMSKYERDSRPFLFAEEKLGRIYEYAELVYDLNYKDDNLKVFKMRE